MQMRKSVGSAEKEDEDGKQVTKECGSRGLLSYVCATEPEGSAGPKGMCFGRTWPPP